MDRDRIQFHGFTAVAPLKHALMCVLLKFCNLIPRLHRRGPIEARLILLPCIARCKNSTASPPWPH